MDDNTNVKSGGAPEYSYPPIEEQPLNNPDEVVYIGQEKAKAQAEVEMAIFYQTQAHHVVESDALLDDDIAQYQAHLNDKTGYDILDQHGAFLPGLYVIGAISSLGKTTFAQQMADQIAENGRPVVYFSLEQSRFEMHTKSLSRRINLHAENDSTYHRYTAADIRCGLANGSRELQEQREDYVKKVGKNLTIVDSGFGLTVDTILSFIDYFYRMNKVYPVVFVDYLQILSPSKRVKNAADQRANVEDAIKALKAYQLEHDMHIIAICSLNRTNYIEQISFESFKESGAIEYTADAVWGLQLAVITSDSFFKKQDKNRLVDTSLSEKRQMINSAKSAPIRKIELVVLKNRVGVPCFTEQFEYESAYDTFRSNRFYYPVQSSTVAER